MSLLFYHSFRLMSFINPVCTELLLPGGTCVLRCMRIILSRDFCERRNVEFMTSDQADLNGIKIPDELRS